MAGDGAYSDAEMSLPQSAPPLPVARRFGLAHWLILIAVALAARGITFGDPVVHVDEEFYFAMARGMWQGALPFVDIWDRKPIGLFLLYWPAAGLPLAWGVLAYQIMALVSLVLTARLVFWMAERAGWGAGALAGAIAYLLWPDLLNGVGGQAPIFYNLPMAAAGALIVASAERHRRLLGAAAMALVGITLQIKYSAVFEGMFFGLWLLLREWRARTALPVLAGYAVLLVALALLPTLIAYAAYLDRGQADAFVYANFGSIAHRNANPLPEMLGNIGVLVLLLSPLVAMVFGARGRVSQGDASARAFLFAWFVAALLGVAVFGTWFDHYGLPVLVPGAACAAGFFGRSDMRRRVTPAILLLVALVGQIVVVVNIHNRGTAGQFARMADAVGRGPGCLYVYSGSTMLYPATERCRLSRYVVPAHLNRARENGATGVDQATEVRRILAARPAVVVMRPPFRGERPEIRAIVVAAMARDYRLFAVTPMGNERIAIFKPR